MRSSDQADLRARRRQTTIARQASEASERETDLNVLITPPAADVGFSVRWADEKLHSVNIATDQGRLEIG